MPTLHIRLLSVFHLAYDEVAISAINGARLQSFFAYLVLHREAPHQRRDLAFLFWPDSTETQAHTNLRKLLYELRRALPDVDRFLQIDNQTVEWKNDAPFTLDVSEFETAAAHAASMPELTAAVERYSGDLLPSCYDDWIIPERERLRQMFIDVLEQLIARLEEQREYRLAVQYTHRLIQQEPVREESYLRLMRLYTLLGDRGGALRAYHSCVTALQRELEIEPSPVIRETYERLLNLPVPLSSAPNQVPRLIGREREWIRLQAAWRAAADGQPQMALLTGEEGIGKTRLAEEMHQWAARQGIAATSIRCFAPEKNVAWASVTNLLRARALPPLDKVWLTQLARLLPEIAAKNPGLPAPRPLNEPGERQHFAQALAHAVLAAQPLLLLIDDLQWCDPDTLEWLHYLLRFDPHARLLIVATLRWADLSPTHPLSVLLPLLRKNALLTEIVLSGLTEADTGQLARQVAGHVLEPTATARLFRETEGNPLFILEMVRAGFAAPSAGEPPPVPATIQAIVGARLAQLSPPARELIDVAATFGRAFTVEELRRVSGMREEELVRALDELWQRRIISEQGSDAYDFNHLVFSQVTANSQSTARRRWLHRRVAEALEAIHADHLDGMSGEIAGHLEQAGLPEQAIAYYLRAGDAARQMHAPEAAIEYYQRVLALLPKREPLL